ncbi:MAG: hypothetical protein ACLGXA_05320 [Acidobacteriota bacterium]
MADPTSPNTPPIEHTYHAEAFALQGDLDLPLKTPLKPQAYVKLAENGGYLSERALDYRLEGIFSFRHAYTQVSGHRDLKPGHGYVTLATSVIEGFNVLDVVTADRIVAQISTEHPLDGYVPDVTFLGTRFENLRIAGHPVNLDLDTMLFGEKPAKDAAHSQGDFGANAAKQCKKLLGLAKLPPEVSQRYNQVPSNSTPNRSIECSLVHQAEGSYPGRSFGHVIDIPHFGKVYLATVRVEESDPHPKKGMPMRTLIRLTMVELKMGCIGSGSGSGGNTIVNGRGVGG